ncbi:GNAT family N-acetyltransferase [Actinacidiphila acidipaludis]|uniref:GNAT family N-acetyltransferase n=1 Tax=Actinacidiphila acidipaludis TaxID=2873382 RepID=A0ABS7QAH9_9ACTN|nr:GNAT family N-acetyltransferase [Streptomyces acidipaludis]MBY8878774.1 GNAT family N-acetyltransferase [Streptomyces acidipaludis]
MSERDEVTVVRWAGHDGDGPAQLLAAYHLRTEAEKGAAVADVTALPERYRAEVSDPQAAFADDFVLIAKRADTPLGCLVVTAPAGGHSEIKRLWTDPAFRGQGVASALIRAALAHTADTGVESVRLSVWAWRTDAIALYERFGFGVTTSWDERNQLVCMERVTA